MEKRTFTHQGNDCTSYGEGRLHLFVERMKNDVNGNPRYKVSPSMTLPVQMRNTMFDCKAFTRRYRGAGKNYAVLQSYNIDDSIEQVMQEWKEIYIKQTGAPL